MSKNLYLGRGREDLEQEVEKRYLRRAKKKNPRMKVSGKSVLKMKDFIGKRGRG